MPIQARCTCGYAFPAADAVRGKTVPCLQCGAPIVIGGEPPRGAVEVLVQRVHGVPLEVACAPRLVGSATSVFRFFAGAPSLVPHATSWLGPFPLALVPHRGGFRVIALELGAADPIAAGSADLSRMLATMAMLGAVQERVGLPAEEFDLGELVLAYRGVLETREIYLDHKFDPQKVGSGSREIGWYVGPDPAFHPDTDGNAPGAIALLPIHRLYATRPMAIALLGLPKDYIARMDGNEIRDVLDPQMRVVWRPSAGEPLFPKG